MFGISYKEKEISKEAVPLEIFRDRTLAPLEAVSLYLKDKKGMSYHEIAVLLNRNDRTVWTCYNRARKKLFLQESKSKLKSGIKKEEVVDGR